MPRIILIILCLLTLLPLRLRAQEESLSHPIYIAAIIVDEPSADDMEKMLQYYGFQKESTAADGFTLFTRSDGSQLRLRIDPAGDFILPTVEVLSEDSPREIHEVLYQAGFRPQDRKRTTYLRGERLSHRYTIATLPKGKHRGTVTIAKKIGNVPTPSMNRESSVDRSRKLRKSTKH